MFQQNTLYKIVAVFDDGYTSIYTGKIINEDDHMIQVNTIKGENIAIHKKNIEKVIKLNRDMENGNYQR